MYILRTSDSCRFSKYAIIFYYSSNLFTSFSFLTLPVLIKGLPFKENKKRGGGGKLTSRMKEEEEVNKSALLSAKGSGGFLRFLSQKPR